MGGPATSGALGSELPHLVVLEVGVDEVPQSRPLGAEGARWRCRGGGGGRAGFVRGHGLGSSSWWRPRAGGVRPHSLWWARQASGMCDGEGTAMWGEPRVAAECTCTEREFGRCSRPTVRPGRTVNDDRDHGDGSDTRPRGRRTAIAKLTKSSSIDPQDTGLHPVANPPCWTSKTAASRNLTVSIIPLPAEVAR